MTSHENLQPPALLLCLRALLAPSFFPAGNGPSIATAAPPQPSRGRPLPFPARPPPLRPTEPAAASGRGSGQRLGTALPSARRDATRAPSAVTGCPSRANTARSPTLGCNSLHGPALAARASPCPPPAASAPLVQEPPWPPLGPLSGRAGAPSSSDTAQDARDLHPKVSPSPEVWQEPRAKPSRDPAAFLHLCRALSPLPPQQSRAVGDTEGGGIR